MQNSVTTIKVVNPSMQPIFWRTIILIFALGTAVFAASCWFASGIAWIYSFGEWPIISCPTQFLNLNDSWGATGYCSLTVNGVSDVSPFASIATCTTSAQIDSGGPTKSIKCETDYPCDRLCVSDSRSCVGVTSSSTCTVLDGSLSAILTVGCKDIDILPYCESSFTITPGKTIAIRGLLCGCLLIALIWVFGEFILRSVEIRLRKESADGRAQQAKTLPLIVSQMRAQTEARWKNEYESNKAGWSATSRSYMYSEQQRSRMNTPSMGVVSRTYSGGTGTPTSTVSHTPQSPRSGVSNRPSVLESRNPKRRFESSAWHRRIAQWQELKSKKLSVYKSRMFIRTCFLNVFFMLIIVGSMYMIIRVSPDTIPTSSVGSNPVSYRLYNDVTIWHARTWLDVLIFIDVILDVLLFIVACLVVHWPKPAVLAKQLGEYAANGNLNVSLATAPTEAGLEGHIPAPRFGIDEIPVESSSPKEFVPSYEMTSNTCLMIACHESTLSEEAQSAFTHTLTSALKVFPPSHIFVCDNGNALSPVDATEFVTKSVHPDINYLYMPEGNKTFAFYWCNKYWIPFLIKCGRIPFFKYALMIDDDVPLPPDLHIPHEQLRNHPEIKAVHFAITATTPTGRPNLLVMCQDIEYKMAAVHKYFQSKMARAMSCHGAVGLWDRVTLDKVFYNHDTVFHGEDLVMGIALLRLRDNSRIISCPQSIVPTYAPDTWGMLFRQRVKSWELTSHKKTFTYLFELLNPASFCHIASLVLKPYFLQEMVTIILDWLRVFLLAGLLLRDWLGLLLMTGLFSVVLYLQVILLEFVYLRQRKDLRNSFLTVLLFPFYRLGGLLFRLCALIHNILVYSKDRKSLTIGYREDEIRDIAPCPPHPDVDWFTCWKNRTDNNK